MSQESNLKILVEFIGKIVWPCSVLLLVFLLLPEVKLILQDMNLTNFKAGGVEIVFEKRGKEIEGQLNLAIKGRDIPDNESRITENLMAVVSEEKLVKLDGNRLLWVDDIPYGNRHIILALQAMGMRVLTAFNTDEAMEYLSSSQFDIVVTDMCRDPVELCRDEVSPKLAGYELLARMRNNKPLQLQPPVIIYSGSTKPEWEQEAREKGAFDRTNDPRVLLKQVIKAIE